MSDAILNSLRRFKEWIERLARKPYASFALFAFGFVEASLLPLSPDVLLIALGVVNPRKSVWYSLLVVAGSSVGALLGYYVGYAFYSAVGVHVVEFFGAEDQFRMLLLEYRTNAWLTLLLAGFTMIPFMVFTMAAGFNATLDPTTLFFAALCGRAVRFVPIGVLLYIFGPKVKEYFDQYLGRTILVIGVLVITLFLTSKYFL